MVRGEGCQLRDADGRHYLDALGEFTAGLTGLTQVLTAEALDALNARGDALRARLSAMLAARGVAMQFTALGSLMQMQSLAGPIRSVDDLHGGDDRARALVFFELLARGMFMARRGFMARSLPFGDGACARFAQALEEVIAARRSVLPRA